MKRRKNLYFGLGPAPTPTKRQRAKSRREFQSGVERKTRTIRRGRAKEQAGLFKQLQRDAKPQHARRRKIKPEDREAFYQMLRENPMIKHCASCKLDSTGRYTSGCPGCLKMAQEFSRKERQGDMATKKRRKRKKNRKSKMPAGLAAYWRKKRAKKNPVKRRRKRARRRKLNPKPRRRIRRRRVVKRVRARNRRPRKIRRRRVKRNPRRGTVKLTPPVGLGPKGLRQYTAMVRKAYPGAKVRVVK
jgi:hypothetical protein